MITHSPSTDPPAAAFLMFDLPRYNNIFLPRGDEFPKWDDEDDLDDEDDINDNGNKDDSLDDSDENLYDDDDDLKEDSDDLSEDSDDQYDDDMRDSGLYFDPDSGEVSDFGMTTLARMDYRGNFV